jgi:hypothetical protein
MNLFLKLLSILYLSISPIFFSNKTQKLLYRSRKYLFAKDPNLSGYDMRYPLKEKRNFTEINSIHINIQKKLLLTKLCDPDISILTKITIIKEAEAAGLLDFNKKKDFDSW